MDTTGQRATQKINIKLLLSEPTKNKFPKSFLLLLVCVCGGGGGGGAGGRGKVS